jgi:hypothetical protein
MPERVELPEKKSTNRRNSTRKQVPARKTWKQEQMMKDKKHTEKITRRRSSVRRDFLRKSMSEGARSPMSWTAGI